MALDPRALISLTRNSSADITISTDTFIELLTDNNGKPITYNNSYIALTLPNTYTRVPYLESTGTQYINTGFYPTTDFKHTLVFEVTSDSNSNKYICGSGVSEGRSGNLRINGNTLNGLYINKSSAVSIISTQTISLNTKYTIVMDLYQGDRNFVILNGTFVENTNAGTIDSTKPLYLWALSSSYLPIGIRIYSSKIEQENGQSYYFIPARRNSDSVLGMYDLISGTFKTNAGSGSFITDDIDLTITLANLSSPIPSGTLFLDGKEITNGTYKILKNISHTILLSAVSVGPNHLEDINGNYIGDYIEINYNSYYRYTFIPTEDTTIKVYID